MDLTTIGLVSCKAEACKECPDLWGGAYEAVVWKIPQGNKLGERHVWPGDFRLISVLGEQAVQRATDAGRTSIQNVRVYHGCLEIAMAEKLLDGPYVMTIF